MPNLSDRNAELDMIAEAFDQLVRGRLPAPLELPAGCASEGLRPVVDAMNRFLQQYSVFANALSAVARGDVDREVSKCRLHVTQSLKNLQANLRHLTWKTQQVANGDYQQRVDFMGEFSQSFNLMVETLAKNRADLQRQNAELQVVSRTDPLTGLLNRRGGWEAIHREASRARRSGRPFALVLADIDHFKQINDTYGHEAGDSVLVEVTAAIRSGLRTQDAFARWGGEEFLVLATDTDLAGGLAVAEHLRAVAAGTVVAFRDRAITVTISAGVSQYRPADDPNACLRAADLGLLDAKTNGRNCVSTCSAEAALVAGG
jgi:diguanylate cyclase (GGDEF)-like protein